MLNPNHTNFECNFAEEIVSFLYGETGNAEKPFFENHLKECGTCANELSAFSDVQLSFADLRNEFSAMKTPLISIPYEESLQIADVSNTKSSWFKGIQAFLENISAWQTATAGFAVLICLAVFSLLVFRNGDDLTAVNITEKSSPKPTVKKTEANTSINPEKSPEIKQEKEEIPFQNQSDVARTANGEQKPKTVVKVSDNPPTKAKNDNGNTPTKPKNKDLKNNNRNKQQNLPRLNDVDETEDDSLRLADIFEEIDTTED
jgi:hypothetical protein